MSNDIMRSFNSLVKYNNGLFKSEKQAKYLLSKCQEPYKYYGTGHIGGQNWSGSYQLHFSLDDKGVTRVEKCTSKGDCKITWERMSNDKFTSKKKEDTAQLIQSNLKEIDKWEEYLIQPRSQLEELNAFEIDTESKYKSGEYNDKLYSTFTDVIANKRDEFNSDIERVTLNINKLKEQIAKFKNVLNESILETQTKTIPTSVYESTNNTLNESVTRDLTYLYKYLKSDDYSDFIFNEPWYIEEYFNDYGITIDDEKFNEYMEDQEWSEAVDWLYRNDKHKFNELSKWMGKYKHDEDQRGYTKLYFNTNPEMVKNHWLLHFTDNAYDVFKDGFNFGTYDISELGLTSYKKSEKGGTFAFAYDAETTGLQTYGASGHRDFKYGQQVVMFRASGVKVYHNTDEEYQVIFDTRTVKDLIVIEKTTYNNSDVWAVTDRKGRPLYKTQTDDRDQLDNAVKWVIENYDRYHKAIDTGKAPSVKEPSKYKKQFESFMDKLKTDDNLILIEAIQNAYKLLFESISDYSDIINSHTIPELVHYDWDKVAFGMSEDDIVNIPLSKLKIKWKGDMENVNGFDMKSYFKNIPFDSLPPIEVSFDGKNFYIEDGHHRYGYAKQLGIKSVPVKVNITANPFDTLGFYIDDIAEYKKRNTLTESASIDTLASLMSGEGLGRSTGIDKNSAHRVLTQYSNGSDYTLTTLPMNKIHFDYSGRYFKNPELSKLAIKQAISDIKNGKVRPIIVSDKGAVLDGNHRAIAHHILGKSEIQAYVPTHTEIDKFDNLRTRLAKHNKDYDSMYDQFSVDDNAEYKKHNTLTESNDTYELDSLDDLMNEMEVEHKSDSDKVLNELRNNLSESEFLKELITGEERYKYRKYLNQFKHDVPVESLKSTQDVNDDMINTWYEEIKYKRPIIIVNGNDIIDGHHKFAAYKKHGIESVPIVDVNELLNYYNQSNALSESVSDSSIYPNEVVYNMVQKNHRKMEDWSDGDISERLDTQGHPKQQSNIVTEGYDHVSMDQNKSRKRLSYYTDYDDKIVIGDHTYLHFRSSMEDCVLWGDIKVFDNTDETEIARSSYAKEKENSPMKPLIDVRGDKRRLGIASNIYQWIEKLTGYKLYPDIPHTKSAEALWNNPNRKFGFDKQLTEAIEKSQSELKRDIVSEINELKKWFRDNEEAYFDDKYSSGDNDVLQKWDTNENRINELKHSLSNFRTKPNVEPDGLYDKYDSPSDLPRDVYNWVFNNSSILTSDATDAVRWSRIINTSNESRYRGDITIYRAVESKSYDEIREGDWVTPYIDYAQSHNDRYFNGKGHILEMDVDGIDVLKSPTGDKEEAIYAPMELSVDIYNENSINESINESGDFDVDKYDEFVRKTDGMDILYHGGSEYELDDFSFFTDYVGHAYSYGDAVNGILVDITNKNVLNFTDDVFNKLRKHYSGMGIKDIRNNQFYHKITNIGKLSNGNESRIVKILKSSVPYSTIATNPEINDLLIPIMLSYADSLGYNIISFWGSDYADYGGAMEFVVADVSRYKTLIEMWNDKKAITESNKNGLQSVYEVAEPTKPHKSSKINRVLNKTTNKATNIFGEQFTTSLGNKVEVIFIPNSIDSYEVVFTVNDSYDDNADKSSDRDPEILAGVVYTVRKIVNNTNIQRLTINPITGEGDKKQVRSIDSNHTKNNIINALSDFEQQLQKATYPTTPSPSVVKIWENKGRNISDWNPYDIYIKPILYELNQIRTALKDNSGSNAQQFKTLSYAITPNKLIKGLNATDLINALKEHALALESNSDDGATVTKNRRESIYNKLIKRYMKDWDVDNSFGAFTLTRKTIMESHSIIFLNFVNEFKEYDPVLIEAIQHGYNAIFESSFSGKELIVVDIQPEYKSYFGFNIYEFTEFLNEHVDEFTKITLLYNGPNLGMVSESEYINWLYENGLDDDTLDKINFFDKGYSFFRNAMDHGIDHDEIVHAIAFMAKNDINDSRDLDDELWEAFSEQFPDDTDIVEFLKDNEDNINIPDLIDELGNMSNNLIVTGGGRNECLAEVLIALKYLGKGYQLLDTFVY